MLASLWRALTVLTHSPGPAHRHAMATTVSHHLFLPPPPPPPPPPHHCRPTPAPPPTPPPQVALLYPGLVLTDDTLRFYGEAPAAQTRAAARLPGHDAFDLVLLLQIEWCVK